MYRTIVPEGEIECHSHEVIDNGVELYDAEEDFIGFIPYSNLRELMNEEVYHPHEDDVSIY